MPKLIVSSELIPEHLPPAAGAKAWSDQFEQLVGRPGEYTFADDVPFHARLEAVPLDGAVLWSMRGTFLGAVRTKEAIRSDGSDCPSLICNFAKPFRVAQRGRETVVGAGSAVLFTEAVTGAFSPGPVRSGEDQVATLSVRLPRAALAGAIGTPEDHLVRAIDPGSEPLRVLKSYADMLMASGGVADPAIARAVGDHLVDLVALTVGANRDAAHLARERGLRAGRLNEVLAAINARYADPAFSLQAVAQQQRVTERHLRDLLHESGAGFAERVLELRLQRAYRLLTEWRHRQRKIIDIAFTAGFNDLSYFNRSFRARFGMTPSDARAMAAADPRAFPAQ